jgi:hypothetical protein
MNGVYSAYTELVESCWNKCHKGGRKNITKDAPDTTRQKYRLPVPAYYYAYVYI